MWESKFAKESLTFDDVLCFELYTYTASFKYC